MKGKKRKKIERERERGNECDGRIGGVGCGHD